MANADGEGECNAASDVLLASKEYEKSTTPSDPTFKLKHVGQISKN